jgi:hypothetical protein
MKNHTAKYFQWYEIAHRFKNQRDPAPDLSVPIDVLEVLIGCDDR